MLFTLPYLATVSDDNYFISNDIQTRPCTLSHQINIPHYRKWHELEHLVTQCIIRNWNYPVTMQDGSQITSYMRYNVYVASYIQTMQELSEAKVDVHMVTW